MWKSYGNIKRYKWHIINMAYRCIYEMKNGDLSKAEYFAMQAWVGLKKCPYALDNMGLIRPASIENGRLIIVDRYGDTKYRFDIDRLHEIKKSHEKRANNDG